MNSTNLFWNYFEPLAKEIVPDGAGTVMQSDGDQMEKLMTASVSTRGFFPAVFVMRPAYKLHDNGAEQFYFWFNVTFYVFCKSNYSKQETIEAAFNDAEAIALSIAHKLRQEHQLTENVEYEYNTTALEPVTMMTLESTQGYEVKLRLALQANDVLRIYL
ncbi:hypothetical protein [Spirosoma oryzicola]|uniref:hypothetical protein n=1 Tax=Spirosoma oryzicola TaxID=2898794 RepID=UPI001E28838E|nr:hypothetical protein [Spirosoma oryzicola]UHG93388.1 hypothetical protein LQ777_10895 [Spirosoma oryzicola]